MTTEEALNHHFATTGILEPGCTRKDWYADNLIWLDVGRYRIPIFFVLRGDGPIILHDLHHLLTGYPPSWRGECELAGWELASGGCRWHLFYWLDRLTFLLLGLLTAPLATLRASARGLRMRNLFDRDPEEVLRLDIEQARALVAG